MYSNLPLTINRKNNLVKDFDSYTERPSETNPTVLSAMIAFFETRGFDATSSESIASILYMQSKRDGYQPMQILDTLKGFNNVELSALVGEVLNYNRYKTSNLGRAQTFTPHPLVQRNIIA